MEDFARFRNDRDGSRLTPKEALQLAPGQAVQEIAFLQARLARLIEAATHELQLASAVGVGGRDHDAGRGRLGGVLGRQVQPVRTRIDFEETTVLPHVVGDA
jgi:hypothetical protein